MSQARVSEIFVSPASGEEMRHVPAVNAIAGEGLEGDRFRASGGWDPSKGADGRQITLVSRESLEAIADDTGVVIPPAKSRRNLITEGTQLNELVGQQFLVGDVLCEGYEICQPCAKMGEVLNQDKAKVVKAMVHRSGLRARILRGGTIETGASISVEPIKH